MALETLELGVSAAKLLSDAPEAIASGRSLIRGRLYYALKRMLLTSSRQRAALRTLHDSIIHEVRNYVAHSQWLLREESNPIRRAEQLEAKTHQLLIDICSSYSDFLRWQVPGGVCTCVKTVVRPRELLKSQLYRYHLSTTAGGSEEAMTGLLRGALNSDTKQLLLLTRARCKFTPSQRSMGLPFSFLNKWSGCVALKRDEEKSPPVHCPEFDLGPGAKHPEAYENPTESYWLHYRSAAKFPIRLQRTTTTQDGKRAFPKLVAGYLCIDSKAPRAFNGLFRCDPRRRATWPPLLHFSLAVADACSIVLMTEKVITDARDGAITK